MIFGSVVWETCAGSVCCDPMDSAVPCEGCSATRGSCSLGLESLRGRRLLLAPRKGKESRPSAITMNRKPPMSDTVMAVRENGVLRA